MKTKENGKEKKNYNLRKLFSFRNVMKSRLYFLIQGGIVLMIVYFIRNCFMNYDLHTQLLEQSMKTTSIYQVVGFLNAIIVMFLLCLMFYFFEKRREIFHKNTIIQTLLNHIKLNDD